MDLTRQVVVYRSWWPASVLLPDKKTRHRCRVYVTDQGLAIYERPADSPHFFSPMDWAATPEPHSRRHVGIDLATRAGLVVVTLTGGAPCCGTALRGWRPSWVGIEQAWPKQ